MPNSAPQVFQGFFRTKHLFFLKKLKFWSFEDCISNNNFWKAFWRKVSVFSVFEIFYVFFRNKTSVFPKNPEFWTSSEHMSNKKFRDALKKTCEIERFQKLSNFFMERSKFAQKSPNSEGFEVFRPVLTFGTESGWN